MRYVLFVLALVIVCVPTLGAAAGFATAELRNPAGELVGMATFTEAHDGVRIAVNLFNMPPGVHALHIHAAGSCEKPDFKSAKGHFNPYNRKHGLKSPDGAHAGDLLNVTVGPDGTCATIAVATFVTLGKGPNSLFPEGGTALMIHEGPDDYMTDPAGAAGPRIACGVIQRVQ